MMTQQRSQGSALNRLARQSRPWTGEQSMAQDPAAEMRTWARILRR